MKRVYCLYRVSTKKQIAGVLSSDGSKDDIPMQKQACHEFAERQGWYIIREFEEKGVSGYKVSASDRDAIQDLKEAALKNEFDVLLVFMFARIGRIDDETPFVVEWFAKHEIEVWSVREGEQRFDSHVDKLTNYIRFWQASGESEKTSIRIKTRMHQLTCEGAYTGGPVPYGYRLVSTGQKNRKGRDINRLEIEEAEAEIVRMIFYNVYMNGYGTQRLARMLNDMDIKTHNGSKFQSNSIMRILKNRIYSGYYCSGDAISPFIPEIQIVEQQIFDSVQFIVEQRGIKNEQKRQIAMSTRGCTMLSGNVFCAHCGGKLIVTKYTNKYIRRDGTERKTEYLRYTCFQKANHRRECDGEVTYRAETVDGLVSEFMKALFNSLSNISEVNLIEETLKKRFMLNCSRKKQIEKELKKLNAQLEGLQLEIGKCLSGEGVFSVNDLSAAIKNLRVRIEDDNKQLESLAGEEEKQADIIQKIRPSFEQLKSWADEFDRASLEQKKMIAGQLFKRIEVGRDYQIHFVMNMTYQQFCDQCGSLIKQAI